MKKKPRFERRHHRLGRASMGRYLLLLCLLGLIVLVGGLLWQRWLRTSDLALDLIYLGQDRLVLAGDSLDFEGFAPKLWSYHRPVVGGELERELVLRVWVRGGELGEVLALLEVAQAGGWRLVFMGGAED